MSMFRKSAPALLFLLAVGCARGGPMAPGSVWDVFFSGERVAQVKSAPGPFLTGALRRPESPLDPIHPFATVFVIDAVEIPRIQGALDGSKDFDAFTKSLEKAGYVLRASAGTL